MCSNSRKYRHNLHPGAQFFDDWIERKLINKVGVVENVENILGDRDGENSKPYIYKLPSFFIDA